MIYADGPLISFQIESHDEHEQIAHGTHKLRVIEVARLVNSPLHMIHLRPAKETAQSTYPAQLFIAARSYSDCMNWRDYNGRYGKETLDSVAATFDHKTPDIDIVDNSW